MLQLNLQAIESAKAALACDAVCRISNVLSEQLAESLRDELDRYVGWELTVRLNGEVRNFPEGQLKAMPDETRRRLEAAALDQQGDPFRFRFFEIPAHAVYEVANDLTGLKTAVDELQGASATLLSSIVGEPITRASVFVSKYSPGCFLSPHTDLVAGETRRFAYVLQLSRDWRAEWGGQLQFLTPTGAIERSFVPSWNTLTIFRVPTPHQVSWVAPLARSSRIALSGWLY